MFFSLILNFQLVVHHHAGVQNRDRNSTLAQDLLGS